MRVDILPASGSVKSLLKSRRSAFVTYHHRAQLSQLTADLVRTRGSNTTQGESIEADIHFLSGQVAERNDKKPKNSRINFARRLKLFAAAEGANEKLVIVKDLSCRPQSGGGLRPALEVLSGFMNDPAKPMVLAISGHPWELADPDERFEPGSLGNLIGRFAGGVILSETGQVLTSSTYPAVPGQAHLTPRQREIIDPLPVPTFVAPPYHTRVGI